MSLSCNTIRTGGAWCRRTAAIVGQNGRHRDVTLLVEGEDIVVQDGDCGFGLLGSVQEAEGIAAIGVHHHMEVDVAHALEPTDVEGILAQQLARPAGLDVAFPEAGVVLLDQRHLLRCQCQGFLGSLLFQFE